MYNNKIFYITLNEYMTVHDSTNNLCIRTDFLLKYQAWLEPYISSSKTHVTNVSFLLPLQL